MLLAAAIALLGLARPAFQEPPETPSRRLTLIAQSSTNRLEDIAVNADETRILTHDREYSPRLWDRKTMRLLRVLDAHIEKAKVAKFSPDGKSVLTASASEVCIWESASGKLLAERSVTEMGAVFGQVTFSSDSQHVVLGSTYGQIFLFDRELNYVESIAPFDGAVKDVTCAAEADVACAADDHGRVVVFSLPTLEVLATYETGAEVLWSRLDRKGRHAVATTIDEKAHLFDVGAKKLLRAYGHYMGTKGLLPLTLMASLFVGKDGENLLIAEESGRMRLYNVETGAVAGALEGHTAQVREIRQSADGTKVATYGDDEMLKIWDAVAQKELPFNPGRGNPTAGEFSPDGSAFWLGFDDGSLRRHDTRTGAFDSEAIGTTSPTHYATMRGRWLFYQGDDNWLVDTLNQTNVRRLGWAMEEFRFSSNGDKATWKTLWEDEYYLCDVASGTPLMRYLNCLGAEFSRDAQRLVTVHANGDVFVWRTSDGEDEKGWTIDKDKPIVDLAVSPVADLVVTVSPESDKVQVWDYMTGTILHDFSPEYGTPMACAFSNKGEMMAVACEEGVGVWKVGGEGDFVASFKGTLETSEVQMSFSPDDKWLLVLSGTRLLVVNLTAGTTADLDETMFSAAQWTPNSDLVLVEQNAVYILDPAGSGPGSPTKLAERVNTVSFSDDGKRMITTDTCDGLVVWKVPEALGEDLVRLGSFVQMQHDTENVWLTTDSEGRYDATDPANVTGAHYVLEWSGGLETIAVEQLKDRFYEPGLLGKILGFDPELPRPVPPLEALKLYPSLTVSRARSGALRVGVEERDGGGVGTLRVWVNGKLVHTRNDPPGFFEIDPSLFDRYYLPSNLLPEGQGNLVRVTVTNKLGDLESPGVTVDVGVPEDLRPPEVRLFALFVGICDYVGTAKDLTAPANDARELEKAVRTVAERLLPGRVETRVLTAEVGQDDTTRAEIVGWFEDVASRASSSDIVVVFFSGHGVNQIAGAQDYFFLTPEADPASVGPLTATTAAISGKQLGEMLSKIAASKQVVILDTCHSGAFANRVVQERSIAGDYRRAWQAIRDATGTWMLAGSAADQLSFESANVGHGMLTYSLLEAIDRGSSQGLRQTEAGELFVDVERWLDYASGRVESLKNEVGVSGVQRPQLARSAGASFDIGVMRAEERGFIGLRPPRPIVIVGQFDQDREDPLGVERLVGTALRGDDTLMVWTDVASHPRAFHLTGSYREEDGALRATVYLQFFLEGRSRKTLEKFDVEARSAQELATLIGKRASELLKTVKLPDASEVKTGGG